MANRHPSPETAPVPGWGTERLPVDALDRVGGLHNIPYGYLVDDDSKAVIKMRHLSVPSRSEYASDDEYEQSLIRDEALKEVLGHGFTFTSTNLLTAEYGAIDMLVKGGKELGFSEDQLLSVSGLKGLFRYKVRESMQQDAANMTEMIKAADQELWVVAHRENASGYTEDPRIARYVGVVLTEKEQELKFEPVILSKDGKDRGLFPAGYAPLVDPIYIVTDRQ